MKSASPPPATVTAIGSTPYVHYAAVHLAAKDAHAISFKGSSDCDSTMTATTSDSYTGETTGKESA